MLTDPRGIGRRAPGSAAGVRGEPPTSAACHFAFQGADDERPSNRRTTSRMAPLYRVPTRGERWFFGNGSRPGSGTCRLDQHKFNPRTATEDLPVISRGVGTGYRNPIAHPAGVRG